MKLSWDFDTFLPVSLSTPCQGSRRPSSGPVPQHGWAPLTPGQFSGSHTHPHTGQSRPQPPGITRPCKAVPSCYFKAPVDSALDIKAITDIPGRLAPLQWQGKSRPWNKEWMRSKPSVAPLEQVSAPQS